MHIGLFFLCSARPRSSTRSPRSISPIFPIRFSAVASILSCNQMRFFFPLRRRHTFLPRCLSRSPNCGLSCRGRRSNRRRKVSNVTYIFGLTYAPSIVRRSKWQRVQSESDCSGAGLIGNYIMPDAMHMLCFSMPCETLMCQRIIEIIL